MTQEQIELEAYEEYQAIQLALPLKKEQAKMLLRECERNAMEGAKIYRQKMASLIGSGNSEAIRHLREEIEKVAKAAYEPHHAAMAEIKADQEKSDKLFRIWNHLN